MTAGRDSAMQRMSHRVVATGLGVVCPLGNGIEPVWSRLISGRSGIGRLPENIVGNIDVKTGATVPSKHIDEYGFDLDALLSVKDQRKMDRFMHLGLEAAKQAIEQAKWFPVTEEEQERTATIIGSSVGGFSAIAKSVRAFDKGDRLSPFAIPAFLINLVAGHVSIRHGFKGPTGAPVSACAASTQAIGDGFRMILSGEADIAICGGAESCIDSAILASFSAAGAVSTHFNDCPSEACRPFDCRRDGFVLGEGAAVIVLESLDHAQKRGVTPIAELVGYCTTSEAHHITASHEEGYGLQRAMHGALKMAGLDACQIGYLNAHASATPLGDKSELIALQKTFGSQSQVSISSTKSATGHLLGAAGGLEAIFAILALRDDVLPPTLNLHDPDCTAKGLDIIGPDYRSKAIEYAMSNSSGFGGVNASVIFKKWNGNE